MPLILGVIGKLSSGKDMLGKILKKYGFKNIILPTVNIVDYLIPKNRENLLNSKFWNFFINSKRKERNFEENESDNE